ncbi:MAG TPA: hypothetical protein VF767_03090 [Bryobacteraceae bacterium]
MMLYTAALLVPALTGWLMVRALSGSSRRLCAHDWWRALFGIGAGIGIGSCCLFLSLCLGLPLFALELAGLAGAASIWLLRAPQTCAICAQVEGKQPPYSTMLFWTAFAVLGAAGIYAFWLSSAQAPDGGWDAWSIWNLRARFLLRGGPHWRDAFSQGLYWSHPDYPLLLPGAVAHNWKWIGQDLSSAPAALAFAFTFGTAGLLAASLACLRNLRLGLVAGIFLLATPGYIEQGASQYADVPLSFFILATFTLLAMADGFPASSTGLTVLAGFAAACAAWTKNEGQLFLASVLATHFAVSAYAPPRRGAVRRSLWFVAGALPVLCVLLYFRMTLAPATDLFAGSHGSIAARVFEGKRYVAIAGAMLEHLWNFGGLAVPPFLLLAAYVGLAGFGQDLKYRKSVISAAAALGLCLAGFGVVYLLSPGDLEWRLNTSLSRLFMQLWPGTIFAALLLTRAPRLSKSPEQPCGIKGAKQRRKSTAKAR